VSRNGDGAEPRNNAVGRWVSGSFWVLSAEITRTGVRVQTPPRGSLWTDDRWPSDVTVLTKGTANRGRSRAAGVMSRCRVRSSERGPPGGSNARDWECAASREPGLRQADRGGVRCKAVVARACTPPSGQGWFPWPERAGRRKRRRAFLRAFAGGLFNGAGPGGMPSGRRACGETGDGPAARSRRPGLSEDGSPELRSTESRACRNGHGLGNSNPWNLDRGHTPRSSVSSTEA
jgi:hypothetical protein